MTFVADFTPEQLRNASAGRRYGQRKREAQEEAAMSEIAVAILRQQLAEAEAEIARLKEELAGEKRYSGITKAMSEQTNRFHAGLMEAFKAAKVDIPRGPIPDAKSLGVWMVEILAARNKALTSALSALVEKWRREAADEQRVSFCADELAALLDSLKEGK